MQWCHLPQLSGITHTAAFSMKDVVKSHSIQQLRTALLFTCFYVVQYLGSDLKDAPDFIIIIVAVLKEEIEVWS